MAAGQEVLSRFYQRTASAFADSPSHLPPDSWATHWRNGRPRLRSRHQNSLSEAQPELKESTDHGVTPYAGHKQEAVSCSVSETPSQREVERAGNEQTLPASVKINN